MNFDDYTFSLGNWTDFVIFKNIHSRASEYKWSERYSFQKAKIIENKNMRFILLIVMTLPLSLMAQDNWLPYRSPAGGFKVLTEGIFKEVVTHTETKIGDIEVHTLVYPKKPKPGETIYTITFYDFPKYSMHSDSTELMDAFYKQTIEAATESVGGKLIYENDIAIHSFKGKQWRINYLEDQMNIKSQAFMANNTYYLLSVVSTGSSSSGSANRFFNSFRLLGYD